MRRDDVFAANDTARALLLLPLSLWSVVLPGSALAHGGTTIAEGRSDGVTVVIQGSDSSTQAARPAVDLATTLDGPGTGPSAQVVYYVRPAGKRSVRVEAERDESGVRHAEISTASRGDWRNWDVSAIVTLAGGERLRVASTSDNPPGPDPARPPAPKATETTPSTSGANDPAPPVAQSAVDDITGQQEAAPAWALPSLGALIAVGLIGLAIVRRRR